MEKNVDVPSDWDSHLFCCWECCLPRTYSPGPFLDQSKEPCPRSLSLPWEAPPSMTYHTRGWNPVPFCFTLGLWPMTPLELYGIDWGPVVIVSQFLFWHILLSSLSRRHSYEEHSLRKTSMKRSSLESISQKELHLTLKKSLCLSQMSDEKQKLLVGPQDNLQESLGSCFLFYIYNLDYTSHFELQKHSA